MFIHGHSSLQVRDKIQSVTKKKEHRFCPDFELLETIMISRLVAGFASLRNKPIR